MRIMIHTDLEGAALVFTHAQCLEAGPAKDRAMRFLTGEVNACVEGILDEEPRAEVVVRDSHGPGGIDYESFTERATLIGGRGTGNLVLDKSFAALFFVGQHAREGTPGAEIDPKVAPLPGEVVVTKRRVSAFSTTDLETILRARNINI